jgi:hypothetical protein
MAPRRHRETGNEGEMRFTVNGSGSRMLITGVYEKRLEFGAYTLIKALGAMVDRIAASGSVGSFHAGTLDEQIEIPRSQEPAESGYGGLG